MSAFLTEIPVDIEAVKRLLPKESYIDGVAWNKDTQKVELTWSNRKLHTPYNIPTPFPVQDMHDHRLPKCVTIRENKTATPPATDTTSASRKELSETAKQVGKEFPTLATDIAKASDNATDSVKVVDAKPKRGVKKPQ